MKMPSIVIGISQLRPKPRSRAEKGSGRKRPRRGDSELGPALDDPGKLSPMENKPKQNRKEKVSKDRESVLVNSLIARIHHAVPTTLTRPKEGEKQHEEEFEEIYLDILMSIMENKIKMSQVCQYLNYFEPQACYLLNYILVLSILIKIIKLLLLS